jgi:acetolactate synthase-1/2/3 large subunit
MKTKLSDFVAAFIARQGVRHVFLLPGGASMHLVDSVGRNQNIEYVACLSEQTCALAAEAYAEYTNHLGVAMVTAGPGGTNALTGVAAAWIESSACLFISGQAKRADMIGTRGVRSMGHQELDIISVVRPITKYAVTILDPGTIRYHLEKAVYLATHGRRGPVWIDIPLDVQSESIDENVLVGFNESPLQPGDSKSIEQDVAKAIEFIKDSKRPVFLIGNGIHSANAITLLKEMLDSVRIPVLLTWKAVDILPFDHPLYCGRPGGIGQRGANFVQQNADCIIVIGARLDLPSIAFDHANFARAAKRVMVDIDPAEIWKMQTEIHLPVCADAAVFLGEFLRQAGPLKNYNCDAWLKKAKDWQKKYPVVIPEYRKEETGYVSTYVMNEILSDELLASDVITTGGAGACSDILMQAFNVKEGQRILNVPGIGAMGSGIPGAIGACLASGRKRTICVDGDGGFLVNIQDLETVRRLNLPIRFFVLNNDGYGSIRAMQKNHFQGRLVAADPKSNFTLPDIVRIAQAYGLKTEKMKDNSEIKKTVQKVLACEGPVVCEVMVSPDEPTAPRVSSVLLSDGTLISKPMEDMSPLLERREFLENMIIPPLDEKRFEDRGK